MRVSAPFVVQLLPSAGVSMSSLSSWFSPNTSRHGKKPLKIPPGDLMSGTALPVPQAKENKNFTLSETIVSKWNFNAQVPCLRKKQIINMQQIESFAFLLMPETDHPNASRLFWFNLNNYHIPQRSPKVHFFRVGALHCFYLRNMVPAAGEDSQPRYRFISWTVAARHRHPTKRTVVRWGR